MATLYMGNAVDEDCYPYSVKVWNPSFEMGIPRFSFDPG